MKPTHSRRPCANLKGCLRRSEKTTSGLTCQEVSSCKARLVSVRPRKTKEEPDHDDNEMLSRLLVRGRAESISAS